MADNLSQYLFKQNFASVGYKIYIRNETSRTLFIKTELIHLKVLKEDGLVIELPVNVCQRGHTLTLFFLNKDSELQNKIPNSGHLKEAAFEAMVRVENIEANPGIAGSTFIDLQLTQYDSEGWKKILNSFSENQEYLNNMISKQHKIRDEE